MKTVKEAAKLTGISVRTLHYYDEIGLLKPTKVNEAIMEDPALDRVQLFSSQNTGIEKSASGADHCQYR